MLIIAPGFLIGVVLLQQFAELPSVAWTVALAAIIPLSLRYRALRFLLAVAAGFLWALVQAHFALSDRLDSSLEGRDLILTGTVASIPEQRGKFLRFALDVETLHASDIEKPGRESERRPGKVRLNWYGDAPDLRAGERWRLTARLKRPWGFHNPGGFDYEAWLFRHGIDATGYVRSGEVAKRLPGSGFSHTVTRLRESLGAKLDVALEDDDNAGVITALTIGSRHGIAPEQWRLLTDTGTNHLLAISGLHIGAVAGFMYFILAWVWRWLPRLSLLWPAGKAAAIGAFAAGAGYAMLAGFAIPTQRAMLMLMVVLGAILLGRESRPSQVLATALLVVLLWDPLAVLAPGFWLSFAAVAVIVYSYSGRLRRRRQWWQWGKLQWFVAIGLIPLTLLFFQRGALIAPLANLFAVPWVSLFVVPVTLVGALLVQIVPALGGLLLGASSWGIDQLWTILTLLSDLPHTVWKHAPPAWSMLPVACGVLLLLAPRGWPARWLGLVLMMPLAVAAPGSMDEGEFELTMLDVGQGLAVLVRTRDHALVFDTGARFSDTFDIGGAVLLPYLRFSGVGVVDTLVISHMDNDHIGGAETLLRDMPVRRILSSEPDALDAHVTERCTAGQHWRSDGVEFSILHPPPDWTSSRNDASCVLRISNAGGSVLLTGDIEALAERDLVATYGSALRSDVLLVPHHGSVTSSSAALIEAVDPKLALASVGYRNRFGFPAATVVERYVARGVTVLNTAEQGAISLLVHPEHGVVRLGGHRHRERRYWTSKL